MTEFYGTVERVVRATGVRAEDLNLDSDDDLTEFLEELLGEATDLMDRQMRLSYLEEDTVPAGLNGIAADVVATALRSMIQSRQTPVVRIDDFAVQVVSTMTLTKDIKDRLKLYAAGKGAVSVELGQDIIGSVPWTITANQLDTMDIDAP